VRQQLAQERDGLRHVLEIVQHQQRLGLAQRSRQGVMCRGLAGLGESSGARHGGRYLIGAGDRAQRDEADTIGELRAERGGEGEGQGGLADAAGTGQGEQADVGAAQQRHRQSQFTLAADERHEQRWRHVKQNQVRRRCSRHDAGQYAPARRASPSIPGLRSGEGGSY
jgi:hypothetical protein